MGTIADYYHILGVSNHATFNEIKEAYRKKVKEIHPDKENGNTELFKRVKEAYDILQNAEKRKQYDGQFFNRNSEDYSKQEAPVNRNPNLTVIRIRRKRGFSLASLSVNAALILIGVLGSAYFSKREK
jgi:curved DNA-binding protein CbpA